MIHFQIDSKILTLSWSRKFLLLSCPFLFTWAQQEQGCMSSTKVMFCRGLMVPQRARHPQTGVLCSGLWSLQLEGYSSDIFKMHFCCFTFSLFLWSSSYSNLEVYFSKAFLHWQCTSIVKHEYFCHLMIHFLVNCPVKLTRPPHALKLKKLQKYFFWKGIKRRSLVAYI